MRREEPVNAPGPAPATPRRHDAATHAHLPMDLAATVLDGALDGLRTLSVLGLLAGGLFGVGLAAVLANVQALLANSIALAVVLNLVAVVLAMVVLNGAGVALMDRTAGRPARPLAAKLTAGARALARSIALALIVAAAQFAFAMAATALLWTTRLPGIGPLLLALLLPLLIAAATVLLAASSATLLLCAPAFWSGQSLRTALGATLARLRRWPLEILLSLLVAGLLTSALAALVGMLGLAGTVFVGGLAGAVVGTEFAMATAGNFSAATASGSGHAIAAMAGSSTLFLLGAVLPLAAQIGSLCHLGRKLDALDARDVVAGDATTEAPAQPDVVPETALEAGLASTLETTALPANETGIETPEPAPQPDAQQTDRIVPQPPGAGERPRSADSGTGFRAADAGLEVTMIVRPGRCPACHASVERCDRFCGECGHPLSHAAPEFPGRDDS